METVQPAQGGMRCAFPPYLSRTYNDPGGQAGELTL